MTPETIPQPDAAERPTWQRYLPAGAAATVAVAAIIGLQASSSSGSDMPTNGPQGAPPGMQSQGQAGQTPPWGSGAPPQGAPQGTGGVVPGGTQSGQAAPGASAAPTGQAQSFDPTQGMASPRTSVS